MTPVLNNVEEFANFVRTEVDQLERFIRESCIQIWIEHMWTIGISDKYQ